jgi:membrane protein required for colicin V production
MSWVDWATLAVLAASTLGGMSQGFFRSACSLLGLACGLVLAIWNYKTAGGMFSAIVPNEPTANAIGFLLIALLVMTLASLAGILLQKTLKLMGLGCLDMLGGALFGFLQGGLLIGLCVLVTVAFFPQVRWLSEARLPQLFFGMCQMSTNMSPDELSTRISDGLRLIEHASPKWMHP